MEPADFASPPTLRAERLREKGDADGTAGSAPPPHLSQHISHVRDPRSLVRDRNKPTPSIRVALSPSDCPGTYTPARAPVNAELHLPETSNQPRVMLAPTLLTDQSIRTPNPTGRVGVTVPSRHFVQTVRRNIVPDG